MLIRFEISNYRSIADLQELSLVAVDEQRDAARMVGNVGHKLLPVAGIYGGNASGKSNVLDAMVWLSTAVATSLRAWDTHVPRDPFANEPRDTPTTFVVDLAIGGVRHSYRLEALDDHILFESLHSFPERRKRLLFRRTAGHPIEFGRTIAGGPGISELVSPQTLVLSAALKLQHPAIEPVARAMAAIQYQSPSFRSRPPLATGGLVFTLDGEPAESLLVADDHPGPQRVKHRSFTRANALDLLRLADLGIDDVEVVEVTESISSSRSGKGQNAQQQVTRRETRLVHSGGRSTAFTLPLGEESRGTRAWISLISLLLYVLDAGQVLICDELDASLHPTLTAKVIDLFHDPTTNPNNAQLIFASHDTTLLNHLNRDEVWLTQKNESGHTSLYSLTDYGDERVRQGVNLERSYLQGRFGAVPLIDQELLRRAVGVG